MDEFESFLDVNGHKVYTQEYIQELRDADMKKANNLKIIAQYGAQERMLAQNVDIKIGGGNRGGSKPLPVTTRVVTPFGYKPIGELKTGDILTGLDGGFQRVIYNVNKGKLPCYKLKFIDGSEVESSYDHAWNVRRTCYASKKRHLNNLDLKDDWTIYTTQMIVDFLDKKKSGELKHGHLIIPIADPVKFTISHPNDVIDTYILGLLLGDGCMIDTFTDHHNVMLSSEDDEILDYLRGCGYNLKHRSGYDYVIKCPEIVEKLKKFGLAGCKSISKFVPNVFKFGTIDERLALLQGLMDTDGTIDSRGHCSFSSISRQLAEDVKFLVSSLGGIATISKNKAGYKKDGEYIECNDVYNVYIKMKDPSSLFRLTRKKDRCKPFNGGISEVARRIVDYEYVGEKECCCIRVSNTNSLFLVEDFVVTHNTFSLLLEGLYDVENPHFNAVIFRREKPDLDGIIDVHDQVYGQYGTFNRSDNDKAWYFNAGGKLKLNYYNDEYEDFKTRFQGHQYSYIGIDEITQMPYNKFKYMVTCNRNAYGIRNRIFGTCNPDPDSWVRKFLDWWIDPETGYPIKERDGVVRYCFMDGDDPNSIYWGDTRREVYEQCKHIIDPLWSDKYESLGYVKEEMFIKSVTFVKAALEDNVKLLSSDPSYVANLAGQDEEQRMRDLDGNWNWKNTGSDLIKMADLEAVFKSPYILEDQTRYASCDIALEGGDNLVMWLWIGWHIADLFVCRTDSRTVSETVRIKLAEWGVLEENMVYDLNGIGQYFKGYFPNSKPFNNMAAPIADSKKEEKGIKFLYANLKSQCAYLLYKKILEVGISIDEHLLERKYSGNGFNRVPLATILQKERKCFRRSDSSEDKGWALIKKSEMKKVVGHSPDFWESLLYRMIFSINNKKTKKPKGLWMY